MEILVKWPPNIEQIRKKFNLKGKHPVFTLGNQIYNPYGNPIPQHLIVHEAVHSVQQEMHNDGIAGWWEQYLIDAKFRLEQELQAYGKQFQYIKENMVRDLSRKWLTVLARDLSSPMYGNIINFNQAKELIKNYV